MRTLSIPFLVMCCVLKAAGSMPPSQPINIPAAPTSLPDRLEISTPDWAEESPEDAPQISAISELTFPDETFVATGRGLDGAELFIWAGGQTEKVQPLQSAHNRLTAVVPADLPKSVMLVWPEKDSKCGAPIRVNGPVVWWNWPGTIWTDARDRTLRVYGKGLMLENAPPQAYVQGNDWAAFAAVTQANPYKLTVELPCNLEPGKYQVWVHNGTGGSLGWSEPLEFAVARRPTERWRGNVNAARFGATPNDNKPDDAAIQNAIDHVAKQGGGVVHLGRGTFLLERPLVIADNGITLEGESRGEYQTEREELTGDYTLLRYVRDTDLPDALVEIKAPHTTIQHLALENGNNGDDQVAIGVYAPHVVLDDLTLIVRDKRAWGYCKPGPSDDSNEKQNLKRITGKVIDSGAVFVKTKGLADLLFTSSDVHMVGPGILVGDLPSYEPEEDNAPACSGILIDNVSFTGYYEGEPNRKSNAGGSGRTVGVILYNAKRVAIENCHFRGADRYHGKTLSRTLLSFNTMNRDIYCGDNISHNVSSHSSVEGMDENQGEQYLFHWRHAYGGLFDVMQAGREDITINTANIASFKKGERFADSPHYFYDSRGSRVQDDVGVNQDWIVFVCAGKGVGQFRTVVGKRVTDDTAVLQLDRPWRVPPDATSRVNLTPAYRQIVIYNNVVDNDQIVLDHKQHGVTFWFYTFDTIVDHNTFRNMSAGVVYNSRYRGPTGWNLTRDNTIENIVGYCGDTSLKPAAYVDHFRLTLQWPEPKDRVWYQVGNTARGNRAEKCEVGAYVHTRHSGQIWDGIDPAPHSEGGIVMSVLENNDFVKVNEGIVLSCPANNTVLRNNRIDSYLQDPRTPLIVDQNGEEGSRNTIVIDNHCDGPEPNLK